MNPFRKTRFILTSPGVNPIEEGVDQFKRKRGVSWLMILFIVGIVSSCIYAFIGMQSARSAAEEPTQAASPDPLLGAGAGLVTPTPSPTGSPSPITSTATLTNTAAPDVPTLTPRPIGSPTFTPSVPAPIIITHVVTQIVPQFVPGPPVTVEVPVPYEVTRLVTVVVIWTATAEPTMTPIPPTATATPSPTPTFTPTPTATIGTPVAFDHFIFLPLFWKP